MARQLTLPGLGGIDPEHRADIESIQEALQHHDQHHPLHLDTLLAPGGELRHWVKDQDPRAKIGDLFKKLPDQGEDQSNPPDWLDDLPSPATLQGIVTENILDLIHDIR